jgi:subtilisin family serine protease
MNGDHNVLIELRPLPGQATVTLGTWTLQLSSNGGSSEPLHLWMLPPAAGGFVASAASDRVKIGSPGASTSAITVGATLSRTHWQDATGKTWTMPGAPGDIAGFTSPGPRRDAAPKPDFAAPGAVIVSALSSACSPEDRMVIDGTHQGMMGTSMSCPIVTGLVALMLEGDQTLTPHAVRAGLSAVAAIPGEPGTPFQAHWGVGLLDVSGL